MQKIEMLVEFNDLIFCSALIKLFFSFCFVAFFLMPFFLPPPNAWFVFQMLKYIFSSMFGQTLNVTLNFLSQIVTFHEKPHWSYWQNLLGFQQRGSYPQGCHCGKAVMLPVSSEWDHIACDFTPFLVWPCSTCCYSLECCVSDSST